MSAATFWNERFQAEHYIYGLEPNAFLAAHQALFPAQGRLLSLGEGEGRNGVHLAREGYEVTALDGSSMAFEKLRKLAFDQGVRVSEWLADVTQADLGIERWEGIYNIFCHLPSEARIALYAKIKAALRRGGVFLTEQFTPQQLAYTSGGPKDPDMLVTLAELLVAFPADEVLYAGEETVALEEGSHHLGTASVVRFIVRKR